ncbi:hypothetical protein HanPSC8_Chr17g0776781 [Helianthus annuus]|nr:hypothetical protein HanPSC8_Chr17g0776781 [Helianthus annuus]
MSNIIPLPYEELTKPSLCLNTIICCQMFSYPSNLVTLTSKDLEERWTSFAVVAISRDMSNALAPLPITTTIWKIIGNSWFGMMTITNNHRIKILLHQTTLRRLPLHHKLTTP